MGQKEKAESIKFHPHAQARMVERGATENEVKDTVLKGEKFPAKHERIGFRRNFSFNSTWADKYYSTKQIEAYAVKEDGWLIISVVVKFF